MRSLLWHLIVNIIAGSKIMPKRIRYLLYRWSGIQTNTRSLFAGSFFRSNKVSIGRDTFINNDCYFENNAHVVIGERCAVGMQVLICTDTHEIGSLHKRAGELLHLPIVIGDGCWIGARATILPGVTIGEGCVIAAGSLVNKDCGPNGLYAGVPAKRIRDL